MFSVVLFKYHGGNLIINMNEAAQIISKIKSFDMTTEGKQIKITITAKEA
jgi:hypothetical protein